MARSYKNAEARRAELLTAAVRLFAERGYEHTSVQAIIDALGLSKGAFYHHFPSKEALLDALAAQLLEAAVALVRPLVADPELSAPAKLLAFFERLNAWKLEQRPLMLDLGRAMYEEANLLVLVRHRRALREAFPPLLAEVIEQGLREGSFSLIAAGPAADILWQLIVSLGEAFLPAVYAQAPTREALEALEASRAAHVQAIERLLGAPEGSLPLISPQALRPWLERLDSTQQGSTT